MTLFPEHWQRVKLESVAEIGSGITKGRKANGATTAVPYLRVANVQAGHIDLTEVKEIDATGGEIERYGLERDDVLMTEGGDPDKLGRGALWDGSIHPCIHQNHIFRVRLDKRSVYPPYFARLLATRWSVDYFLKAAKQTTGIATINKTQLRGFPVPLPPLPEQKRIAAILDKADAIRRKRQEAIRLTEDLLRSAFLDMFGDPVTNPKGWEVRPLGSVLADAENGWSPICETRPAEADEWAVLKLGCVTKGRYDATENKAMTPDAIPRQDLEVKPGDLLFSRKNTFELVGATAFVFETPPRRTLPDTVFRLRLANGTDPVYLWQLLSHPAMRAELRRQASGTAGSMPNISKGRLREVAVPLPPAPSQDRFRELAYQLEALRNRNLVGDGCQVALASGLTQRAFSGRL